MILLSPIIMGRLRIPHIIGMVLAGVLVGKYGLNILGRDASFELFGRVGLYYIMFLAGLEMDMEGLNGLRYVDLPCPLCNDLFYGCQSFGLYPSGIASTCGNHGF